MSQSSVAKFVLTVMYLATKRKMTNTPAKHVTAMVVARTSARLNSAMVAGTAFQGVYDKTVSQTRARTL